MMYFMNNNIAKVPIVVILSYFSHSVDYCLFFTYFSCHSLFSTCSPSYSFHSRLKPQDFDTMQAFAGPGLVHLSSLLKTFTDTTVLK